MTNKYTRNLKNYEEFINESKVSKEPFDAFVKGISAIGNLIKDDPEKFIKLLDNAIRKNEALPSGLRNAFEDEVLQQSKQIDNLIDTSPLIHDEEGKIEAQFNRRNKEEQKIQIDIAKIEVNTKEVLKPDFNKMGDFKYNSNPWKNFQKQDYLNILKEKKLSDKLDNSRWNLLGLRNKIEKREETPNGFIDAIVLLPPSNNKSKPLIFEATTVPGPAFRVAPYRAYWISRNYKYLANSPANKGVAIMMPGKYRYIARGNRLYPIKGVDVERYSITQTPEEAIKFKTYNPGNFEKNNSSILIHGARGSERVNNWSAGCQVIKNDSDLDKIISIIKKEQHGEIDYLLINI